MQKYKILSKDEERDLFIKYKKTKNIKYKNKIIEGVVPAAYKFAKKFSKSSHNLEDNAHDCIVNIVNYFDSFYFNEHDKNQARFLTVMKNNLHWVMYEKHIKSSRKKHQYIGIDLAAVADIEDNTNDKLDKIVDKSRIMEHLSAYINNINNINIRTIMHGYYFLDKTQADLCKETNIKHQYISFVINKYTKEFANFYR